MTDVADSVLSCPRDGTTMAPMGRRPGAWRCPECKAMFLDVRAMRRGRDGRPPMWAPVAWSIAMSILATVVVRRLRRRSTRSASQEG